MNKEAIKKLADDAKDLKVLYVEDNEDARNQTLLLLENFFDEVTIAVDGKDGLTKYESDTFDLVISDINMPKIDGIEMSKAIFKRDAHQVIIIISAHNESHMLSELINMGVNYFLQKPVDIEIIVQVLSKCVNQILEKKSFDKNVKEIKQLNYEFNIMMDAFDKNVIASRTDPKGIITYISEAFGKIAGYEPSELIGKPHNIIRHPDMPKEAFKELWETVKAGNTWQGEVKNLKKDGTYYWVKANISPYYDKNTKELIGYSAIREDITYQKEVLTLSDKIANLLNNAGEGFLSFDSDLIIENTLSRESLNLLGDDIAGKNIAQLLYAEDDKKRVLFEDIIKNIVSEGDEFSKEMLISLLEKELIFKDKILKLEYKLLENNRFMLVISDISDKKVLERKIENKDRVQKMVVAAVSNYDEFFDLISEYKIFIREIDMFADEGSISELYRKIHTFKGLFAQKEMVNLVQGLHLVESQISSCKNNCTKETISSVLNNASFETWLEKDMKILIKVLGDDFLNNKNKISIDLSSLERIEQKIISLSKQFKEQNSEFDNVICELKSFRASSLKDLLSSYPTLTQQISKKLEKPIYAFEIEGERSVKVPVSHKPFIKSLVHVFRNSVDHGVESMEERMELGKDEMASISCKFSQNKDELVIEISDDGKGIDVDILKSKIVEKGVFTLQEVEKLSHKEQLKLIFAESVSTKDSVSELSGRGIGLSAVKAELDKLNGSIEVVSEKNRGTKFTFKTLLKEYGEEDATV